MLALRWDAVGGGSWNGSTIGTCLDMCVLESWVWIL